MSSRVNWLLLCALLVSFFPSGAASAAPTPPKVSVSPIQFSPNGDGDRDTTRITVTLYESGDQVLRVLDSNLDFVGKIISYSNRSAGTYGHTFDGKVQTSSGEYILLPEGTYYAEAEISNSTGSSKGQAKFYVNNTLKNVSVRSTPLSYNGYNSIFSPNGDGRKDGLVARYDVARPAKVTMRVYAGGQQVYVNSRTYTGAGNYSLTWSGRVLQDGSWVWAAPEGSYRVRIEAVPTDAAEASQMAAAYADRYLSADKSRPSISGSLTRTSFTPSAGESTTYNYTAGSAGYRQVKVYNSSGSVVYSTSWAATSSSGSFTWNGRNSSGSYVAAGSYSIRLYMQDRAGNAATYYPLSRSVTVGSPTSGSAARKPWSGYWWPQLDTTGIQLFDNPGPMTKYDAYARATGRTGGARAWEYNNHRTTNPANDWWGHCQAWSAAAIMEPQPYGTTKAGVYFSQDDAEGLYSETWTRHTGWMTGTRYRDEGTGSEAYKDVYPADFDQQVRYWIGEQRIALIMDYTTDIEVWNYPVYAFNRSSTKSGDREYVKMTLTRAAPSYGVSGTSPVYKTFYYTLAPGSKGWWYNPSGSSVHTHPDYIVRVAGRATEYGNPNVKPSVLNEIFR